MRLLKLSLILILTLFFTGIDLEENKTDAKTDQIFAKKIYYWQQQVKKDPLFAPMLDGRFTFTPLPNNNILINFFTKNNKQFAYLILKQYKENYYILEYGIGKFEILPYKLFYQNSLEAYWRNETENCYIDARTLELLPDLIKFKFNDNFESKKYSAINLEENLDKYYYNEYLIFDPFWNLSWLLEEQKLKYNDKEKIKSNLKQQRILYYGYLYDNMVLFAAPIVGYHQFNDSLYFMIPDYLAQESLPIRFVPYTDLLSFGSFIDYNYNY